MISERRAGAAARAPRRLAQLVQRRPVSRVHRAAGPGSSLRYDPSLPVLVMRIGNYPLHHGTLGVVRSLGRVGVPVYTVAEHAGTPAARSAYAAGTFVLPTTGAEPPDELVASMIEIAAGIGRRAAVVCTDDEAAVLVAENRDILAPHYALPEVPPTLPRRLASKLGLLELCAEHGVDTPAAVVPRNAGELERFAATCSFPLMAKNLEAFTRLQRPAVRANTVVQDADELMALAAAWSEPYGVLLQEYVPPEVAEDWIVHAYLPGDGRRGVAFTGFKLRSWPPYAGVTTRGRTVENDELSELSRRFCAAIGYRGIADLDWRLDRRDGRYKLLDFNPRVGAQFRLFDDAAGVDVVRALHLDLSGRPIPDAAMIEGRDLVLEHLDLAAALAYRRHPRQTPPPPLAQRSRRLAWAAADDPVPAAVAYTLAGRQLAGILLRSAATRFDRTRPQLTGPVGGTVGPAGAGLGSLGAPAPPTGGHGLALGASSRGDDAGPEPLGPEPVGRPRVGSEPVEPGMAVAPDDDDDLADDVRGRHRAPVAAVIRDAPAVPEHEVVPGGNGLARNVELALGAVAGEGRQPGLGEGLAVEHDGVPPRPDRLAGQADDPLHEVLGLRIDPVGRHAAENHDVAEMEGVHGPRQLVDEDAVAHLQGRDHRS